MSDRLFDITKPCRACTVFDSKLKEYSTLKKKQAQNVSKPIEEEQHTSKECPLDVNELGNSAWGVLHTTAAYYPEKPTQKDQKDMEAYIDLFAKFYPCDHCASDLRKELVSNRPDASSAYNLSQWMCRLHNGVSRKLGKPEFDCSKVFERWRDGWKDGTCD